MLRRVFTSLTVVLLGVCVMVQSAGAQSLEDFEDKVTEFTLDNGLTFLVIERPVAPVVSFATYVDVGSANEPVGHTGIAHVFEHMAFKGTQDVGTNNWKKEKKVLKQLDETYQQWLAEKYKPEPDTAKINELWSEFKKLQEDASQYVVGNEYTQIVRRHGATGLNAGTGADLTIYYYSLPENRKELWFSMESARFKNPVFREFYKEKNVVREERRGSESQPFQRLLEEFRTVAYTTHPYGHPTVGWHSDITATTIEDVRKFYEKHYVPNNMTIAIAGDIDPDRAKELAKTYFGDIPKAEEPPPVFTKEPDQRGERRFTIQGQTQPFFIMGYHTVPEGHPDFQALQLLGNILSGGRTSVLYKRMVEEEQTALQVSAFNGYPGTKYETMFATIAIPNRSFGVDTMETTILDEIEKVKNGNISKDALDRARTNVRANLIRSLDSNQGLATTLAITEGQRGDWQTVFTDIEKLENITIDDLQSVAQKYLTKDNRTVGAIVPQSGEEVADANQ